MHGRLRSGSVAARIVPGRPIEAPLPAKFAVRRGCHFPLMRESRRRSHWFDRARGRWRCRRALADHPDESVAGHPWPTSGTKPRGARLDSACYPVLANACTDARVRNPVPSPRLPAPGEDERTGMRVRNPAVQQSVREGLSRQWPRSPV